LFSQRLLQDVFVEREVGDQPLQSPILVLELADLSRLIEAQVRVLLLPEVERGFR
jgi:hypothetical protein